ncbi:MAG: hypothetical protein EHM17_03810 [Verrucomicrobiaceae bacterium]|nr:MAG: hypothetical protein EHM17_03810 [Verrucomicrobiaceae bacterium]
MKLENKDLRNIETINPQQEPADSFGPSAEVAGPAHSGSGFPDVAVKSRGLCRPMFVVTGVALCMGVASCIVPYDSHGGGSATVTTYRPGYTVTSLPGGYRSENISGSTYYYHDGYYYRPGSGGYVVVDAPRSSRYYDDYNRRQRTYQASPDRHDGRYDRGEVITRLPDGYRVVNYRGETYYQAGDRYYRRQGETYVITTRPY